MSKDPSPACRAATAEEIDHFKANGWAKLNAFFNPTAVSMLLTRAQTRMGPDGDGNSKDALKLPYFNREYLGGVRDPELAALYSSVGVAARQLMARKAKVGVRYYSDVFAVKLPATANSAREGNKKTDYHQDWPSWSFDRTGGMTFWVALTDIGPEAGTMSFVSGSHRRGPLANFRTHVGRDLTDVYPELLSDLSSSENMSYRAGDATVHADLCVHCAGENLTRNPRWAYILSCIPGDACWNGAPPEGYSAEGLTKFAPLDDARFPFIAS
jgi:hypothetical protein